MPSDHHHASSAVALDRGDAMLLVVDVQEKLARAMPPDRWPAFLRNLTVLVRAARRLGLPVIATEQYRKGLGPTVPELRELLPAEPLEKLEFSVGANKAAARTIVQTGRKQVIVAGMESHVCVFQTVRDLVRGEFAVFLAQDAVLSRAEANRQVGLSLCEKSGATLTSTEAVLFDLLGAAGTPEFKELAPLIK
jgi:nicotinamidase-related amidase